MTVLRFGTDTGHVAPRERLKLASAGGGFSQGVTPNSTMRIHALACVETERQLRACSWRL
jgi:hypothetical protein